MLLELADFALQEQPEHQGAFRVRPTPKICREF